MCLAVGINPKTRASAFLICKHHITDDQVTIWTSLEASDAVEVLDVASGNTVYSATTASGGDTEYYQY